MKGKEGDFVRILLIGNRKIKLWDGDGYEEDVDFEDSILRYVNTKAGDYERLTEFFEDKEFWQRVILSFAKYEEDL